MAGSHHNETLGQTIIPVINKLQDIFSQVGLESEIAIAR